MGWITTTTGQLAKRFQPSLEAVEEAAGNHESVFCGVWPGLGRPYQHSDACWRKDFRGRLFYFFKDEALNANTFTKQCLGLKRLPLQEHTPVSL
jgi:hypothetical protein